MNPRVPQGAKLRFVFAVSCAIACIPAPARAQTCIPGVPAASDGACVIAQTAATASAPATHAAAGAACPASTDARVIDLQIQSPALQGAARARLVVPADWSSTASRTWPVLYLLNGHGNSFRAWSCAARVEAYLANAEVIVVMPDGTLGYNDSDPPDSLSGGTPSWYSNWFNAGQFQNGHGNGWETFHLQELRQILEGGYRAGTTREIGGLSMGGFGALSYAARNTGMFAAAASYSGVLETLDSTAKALIQGSLLLAGQSPNALWGDPTTSQGLAIWQRHDPTNLVSSLAQLPMFISSGNGTNGPLDSGSGTDLTEAAVLTVNQDFVNACSTAGCAHLTTDFYGNGTHNWPYWDAELCRSLPMLMSTVGVAYTPAVACPTP